MIWSLSSLFAGTHSRYGVVHRVALTCAATANVSGCAMNGGIAFGVYGLRLGFTVYGLVCVRVCACDGGNACRQSKGEGARTTRCTPSSSNCWSLSLPFLPSHPSSLLHHHHLADVQLKPSICLPNISMVHSCIADMHAKTIVRA